MKKYIFILCMLYFSTNVYAFSPFEGENPIMVLMQTDLWFMVIEYKWASLAEIENGQYKIIVPHNQI